jgi:hypothetical protein
MQLSLVLRAFLAFAVSLSALAAGAAPAANAQATEPPPAQPPPDAFRLRIPAGEPNAELPTPLLIDPGSLAPATAAGPAAGKKTPKGIEFIGAPIPISNPGLGTGLGAVAALVFPIDRADEVSPPTTAGLGGFYTSNDSYAFGLAFRTYLAEDRWRFVGGGATGRINYDFFGVGAGLGSSGKSIPLSQTASGFGLEALRRVSKGLFAGVRYVYADSTIRLNGIAPPDIPVPEGDRAVVLASLGPHVQVDTRDSTFYPTRGTLFDLHADFYDSAFGGDRGFQSYTADVNVYVRTGDRQVLAMRASGCAVKGDAPLYALCLFGSHNDLRGYESGQYRDRAMFAAQAEYRLGLPERLGFLGRFGLAAFAGVGGVASGFGDFSSDELLPSGGFGLRYLLTRESHINLRVDWAWGKGGSNGIYVGVGEAF